MPYTFVEIEERKTRRLACLFAALVVLYIASILSLLWGARLILGLEDPLTGGQHLAAIGLALALAVLHWSVSSYRLIDRVLFAVSAKPLDPGDTYHGRLKNIIEEVAVATGGRRIEPYVISTPAMNACAVADFSGRSAIAVTEGLLARLNRAQLESVVGHEAAHIASGDSLSKSVFCGLFGLHEESLKRLSGLFSGRSGLDLLRGRGGALILFIMVVLWVTNIAKRICELVVSREQEYRADAVAVRLTRNPLSLAEALRLIETHWRGVGVEGESLSPIFILDPGVESLSERDGLMADMFSTHPPTANRIALLVGMAHMTPEDFERQAAQLGRKRPRELLPERPTDSAPTRWFAHLDGAWQGPLPLEELVGLPGLKPDSWVRRERSDATMPAYQDPSVLPSLHRRYGQDQVSSARECPNCHIPLSRVSYEGVPLDECPACRGCYVTPDQVTRILTREEYAFPESIVRLAKATASLRGRDRIVKRFNRFPGNRLKDRQCPACGSAVVRKLYTDAYPVEVEQCWLCGLAWLDQHERELLQCLYGEYQASAP